MKFDKLAQNPNIKKLIRECDKGDILFSEGSSANTVLLILSGSLQLTRKKNGQVSLLTLVGPGEFIGEKALLQEQSFPRAATATALAPTTLLELGSVHFSQLESEAPSIYNLLLKKAFKSLISRNERSESLNQILKSYDAQKRFLLFVHFLATQGENTSQGKVFFLDEETTASQINCSREEIQEWVQVLVNLKLICTRNDGRFSTPDENVFLTMEPSTLAVSKAA